MAAGAVCIWESLKSFKCLQQSYEFYTLQNLDKDVSAYVQKTRPNNSTGTKIGSVDLRGQAGKCHRCDSAC